MPTLIFRGSDGKDQRKELSSELTVGREAGNDVVLTEQGVSRKHCRFFVDGGAVFVEDLGSANGVLVDGERIGDPTEVGEGSEVTVGGCVVKLGARRAATAQRPARPSPAKPVAALARSEGAGPSPKRATRMMAVGEAPKRARPVARAPASRVEGRPLLRGMAGPFMGQTFELDKPKLLVGRVPPADVMLDDDSVSRRHAEILKIGPRFSVRDLGSANGTFVNGERVSEAPLAPTDVVRFGVVELSFAGPASAKGEAGGGGKKKLILIGAVVVVLLLVVGVIAGGGGDKKIKGNRLDIPTEPVAEDPQKLMGQCMGLTDPESEDLNWEKGFKICTKVHELDPTLGASKRIKVAKKELDNEKKLVDAKLKVSTTQEEEALKVLVQIDKDSSVFPRAKQKFDEAAGILLKKMRSECKNYVNGGMFETGYAFCQRCMELTCNRPEGVDPEASGLFQNAARNMGKGKGDYKCPPEYKQYQGTVVVTTDSAAAAEAAIKARYPDPAVAKIVQTYFNIGRPKQASDELKRMRARASAKDKRTLSEIIQSLDILEGRWTTAQGYLRMGKASDAHAVLDQAFEADSRLIPAPLVSALLKEMKQQLAKCYFDQSKDEIAKQHYSKAFANVHKAYLLDDKNTDVANAFSQMEREALREINDDPTCASYLDALSITAPTSSTYKKAMEGARKAHCQGLPEGTPEKAP